MALDDDLMRRFGGERIQTVMNWAGLDDDAPLENRMVTKAIEGSQVKVESHHFDIRKHLVEYDDVVNTHRNVIYEQRDKVLVGSDMKDNVLEMIEKELVAILDGFLEGTQPDNWDVEGLIGELQAVFPLDEKLSDPDDVFDMTVDQIYEAVLDLGKRRYEEMEQEFTPDVMRRIERDIVLRVIDSHWVQHLTSMENLRQGIGLYSYGQRDPLVMYKKEGFDQFQSLLERIQTDVARMVFHVQVNVSTNGGPQRQGQPRSMGRGRPSGSVTAALPQSPTNGASNGSDGQKMSRAERRAMEREEKKAAKKR